MNRVALKKAEESKDVYRARVGAVIANKKQILSSGINQMRGFKFCPTDRKWPNSLHAEQDAILKLLNSRKCNQLIGSTIFISRILRSGKPGNAKPCKICEQLIKAVGIKKVVYTTETGVKSYRVRDENF
jgi:deoxycytidylate deaminase